MNGRSVCSMIVLAVLTSAMSVACGGGGGGGTTSGGLTATFSPAVSSPPAGGIGMRAGSGTGDLFEVKISVTGNVADLYRASFHVIYDAAATQYVSASDAGSFLRDGGAAAEFDCQDSSGDLAVTATRLPSPTNASPTFTPASGTPSAKSMTMQPGASSGDTFEVRIAVSGIADFFGTAFHVGYDPAIAEFVSADSSASFLRDGGAETRFLYGGPPGDLAVSATRVQDSGGGIRGVSVSGTRDLMVLRFRAKGSATASPFSFTGLREVRDSGQPPPGNAISASWAGGALAATIATGVRVTGTRDLVVLRFRARAPTSGSALSFGTSRQAEDSKGAEVVLAGWTGGTLVAR